MTALLELHDVEARYGPVQALRGVSLEVPEGTVVAVLGANGAGKTTTLRAVSGTVKRTARSRSPAKPFAPARRPLRRRESPTSRRAGAPSPSSRSSRTSVSARTRGATGR